MFWLTHFFIEIRDGVSGIFITKNTRICVFIFPDKLCSKQFILRSLWKKVRRLEKSTPPPVAAVVTNMS